MSTLLDVITRNLKQHGGTFAVSYDPALRQGWTVAVEWGREAPDSPMAGAAAYGVGDNALGAIQAALDEAGWLLFDDDTEHSPGR
jgi:hypothetical protein